MYLSLRNDFVATKRAGIPNSQPFRSFVQLQSVLPGLYTRMIWDADFLPFDAGIDGAQVSVSGWPSV